MPSVGVYEYPHSGNPVHTCSTQTCATQHWNVPWKKVPEYDPTEMGSPQIPKCFMAEHYSAFRIVWDSGLILV